MTALHPDRPPDPRPPEPGVRFLDNAHREQLTVARLLMRVDDGERYLVEAAEDGAFWWLRHRGVGDYQIRWLGRRAQVPAPRAG